jgi:23S rRNA (cytidine2498-2'-O)-methyltransferase
MTCQCGAERFLKQEVLERYHDLRFSYSRSGFVTFKATQLYDTSRVQKIQTIFSRYCGLSLGRVQGEDFAAMVAHVWEIAGSLPIDRVHVFPRDSATPGEKNLEPQLTPECFEIHKLLTQYQRKFAVGSDYPLFPAEKKELILDVLLVSQNEWWIGFHVADDWRSRQPGGIVPLDRPNDAVSRAYLKFEEALRWSEIPVKVGSHWLDVGAAPGGASQALLARGANVIGIDPAQVSPVLLKQQNFTHLRGRINQIKRNKLRKTKWIVADINVAPNYTLDVLEDCVLNRAVNIRGLLFTLKLIRWELIDEIPKFLQRVKSWGFRTIFAKQMQFNRQEIMVAAKK